MAVQIDNSTVNEKSIFSTWQDGIADSPELGFGVIRNTEIGMFPGQAIPGLKPATWTQSLTAKSYTVNATTNVFTVADTLYDKTPITFSNSGGTFPAGISNHGAYDNAHAYAVGDTVEYGGKIYVCDVTTTGNIPTNTYYWSIAYFYVKNIDATTFTISRLLYGADIDITSTGTGTNTYSTATVGTPKYGLIYNYLSGSTYFKTTFILDSTGNLWFRDSSNDGYFTLVQGYSKTTAGGNGLTQFKALDGKDYLVVCTGRYANILNITQFILDGSTNWLTNSSNLEFTNQDPAQNHSCLLGQDNIIYFCDGRFIKSFAQVGTFSLTDGATYTHLPTALTLPGTAISQCLEELGVNLLIGDLTSNYIYPWDRTSTNFSIPLRCPENGIWKMLNIDNTVYILAGKKGVIYSTEGYQVKVFRKFPEYVTGGQVVWGGLEKVNGHLIIGLVGNKAEASSNRSQNAGVYKVFLHTLKAGTFVIDNGPLDGSTTNNITCLVTYDSDSYFMGYSGGIDYVAPYQLVNAVEVGRYQNYESTIETPFISVSDLQEHRSFELTGLELGRELGNNESIKVYYRKNITSAYTLLGTFDYSTFPAMINDYLISSIVEAQGIQCKITMSAASPSSGYSDQSPRLKTLTIK